jgi:hypothetical protein
MTPFYFKVYCLEYAFTTLLPEEDPVRNIIARVLLDNELSIDQFVLSSYWQDLPSLLLLATKADLPHPNIHDLEVGDCFPIGSIGPALALLQSFWLYLFTYRIERKDVWNDNLWFEVDCCAFSSFREHGPCFDAALEAMFAMRPSAVEYSLPNYSPPNCPSRSSSMHVSPSRKPRSTEIAASNKPYLKPCAIPTPCTPDTTVDSEFSTDCSTDDHADDHSTLVNCWDNADTEETIGFSTSPDCCFESNTCSLKPSTGEMSSIVHASSKHNDSVSNALKFPNCLEESQDETGLSMSVTMNDAIKEINRSIQDCLECTEESTLRRARMKEKAQELASRRVQLEE